MEDGSLIARRRKKTVEHAQNKARLAFDVAGDLFASFEIDLGTRLLLRSLAKAGWLGRTGRILDVGCGYGPIGVTLGALNPEARVSMVDRDLLAVAFARHNAARNGVEIEACAASLGYDDLPEPGPYDLVASNVPAKAGEAAIESIVLDSAHHLSADGVAAVVVIDRIAPFVAELVEANATVVARDDSRGYVALSYRPNRLDGPYRPGFERGIYDRAEGSFAVGPETVEARTVWGLPEFDTPSYSTGLAGRHLAATRGERYLFVHPGQGLLPALLGRIRPAATAVLRSRDRLALHASARNAGSLAAIELEHSLSDEVPAEIDVAVYHIADDEPTDVSTAAVAPLLGLPTVIVHGGSTRVGRVANALRIEDHERTRYRGSTSLLYRAGGPRRGSGGRGGGGRSRGGRSRGGGRPR